MPTSTKRLPIILSVGTLLVLIICGAILSAGPFPVSAQTPAATPPALPMIKVTVGDNGTPQDGVVGSYCWVKADGSPNCEIQPEAPQPTASVQVTAQDTLTFTIDPAEPAPETLTAKSAEDSGPSQNLEIDLAATKGELKGADLPDGKYRLLIEADYKPDAQGNQPYITYIFLIDKAAAVAVEPTETGTAAATEAVTPEATEVSATEQATEVSAATVEATAVETVEAPTAEVLATGEAPTPEEVTPTSAEVSGTAISATEEVTPAAQETSAATVPATQAPTQPPPTRTPTNTPAPPTNTPTPEPPTLTPTDTNTPTITPQPFIPPTATPLPPAPGTLTATPAASVTVTFAIQGTVYDLFKSTDSFVGIPGASVAGIFGGSGVIANTTADENGRYVLSAKATSERLDISLNFSAPGYQNLTIICQASGPALPEEGSTFTAQCNAGLQALPPTASALELTSTQSGVIPAALPSFTPTIPTKVPVITATAGAAVTLTAQPTSIAPLSTVTVGGRVYQPIAVTACVTDRSGQQICVTRPNPSTLDRILAAPGDVAQIKFGGPRPTSMVVSLSTADGTKVLGSQSVPADNLALYIMPAQAGSYVLSVEVTWADGKATYLYRLVVGS